MPEERIRPRDILRLLKEQCYRCAYTGDELTPQTVSADHLIPVASGGTHELSNIRLVTRQINQMKGTLGFEEFVVLCRKVAEYADRGGQSFVSSEGALIDDDSSDTLFDSNQDVNDA